MIKPIGQGLGFVFKNGNVRQIQWKDKCVTVFENDKFIEKIYVDTKESTVLKKIFEWIKKGK